MKNKPITQDQLTEFLLYTTPDGDIKVEIFIKNETVWLTQKRMAELFDVGVPAISKHLNNIFEEKELDEKVVVSILENTTQHGAIEGRTQTKEVKFYNLDAIIAVGYRVNSKRATQFRIWATQVLCDYIIKGFAMDDERLNNGNYFGKDYFRELLERVRSIRSSERRIYQQITDIFRECSIDYDKNSDITKNFYATVQNKFHFAISGKTATEIIASSADTKKPNMGLTTWKGSPDGRILKSDVTIAKNYLPEKDIKKLERTVSGYFDYIERLIENNTSFTMDQLAESVNKFLEFNEYRILDGKGKISQKQATKKASDIYDTFNKTQRIDSDFDKEIKRVLKKNSKLSK